MRELIDEGVTGFLVGGASEAAAAVDRVGGLDRRGIRASAVARFDRLTMVDRYVDVYDAVLATS